MASHQGLHCLLKRKSFYVKRMKKKNQPDTPKMKNGLFLIIRMEESIRLKRVNVIQSLVKVLVCHLALVLMLLFLADAIKETFVLQKLLTFLGEKV